MWSLAVATPLLAVGLTSLPAAALTLENNVTVGREPIAVAVDQATNRIYVANITSGTVSVINGTDNSVTTVTVGNDPTAVAVNQATNRVYVANAVNSGWVSVINDATLDQIGDEIIGGASSTIATVVNAARDATITAVNAARDSITTAIADARDAVNSHTDTATAPATALAGRTNNYTQWFFAAGSTVSGVQETLALFSPTAQTVTITYYTESGAKAPVTLNLPANTRVTVDVNAAVGSKHQVSTQIVGASLFYAERVITSNGAMGTGSGEHN